MVMVLMIVLEDHVFAGVIGRLSSVSKVASNVCKLARPYDIGLGTLP